MAFYPNSLTRRLPGDADFMPGINRKFGEIPSVDDFDCGDGTAAVGDCKFEVFVSTESGSTAVRIGSSPGTGAISSSGILVSGVGTAFLTEARTGKAISVGAESKIIAAVLNDSALMLESAFSVNLSSVAFTISQTSFNSTDVGKTIGVFGAGSSGRILPILTIGMVSVPVGDSWQVVNDYSNIVPVTLDTLGSLSARFAITCRHYDIEWEVFGSADSSFSSETSVYGPVPVQIADGEVGGRDLFTIATAPPFRYYRLKVRNLVAGNVAHSYGCCACYGYLHRTLIQSIESSVQATMQEPAAITRATAQAYWGKDESRAIINGLQAVKTTTKSLLEGGRLGLPGAYLVTQTIVIPNKVKLTGNGLNSAIVCDPGVFPEDTAAVQLGEDSDPGAYSCRLEDAYIYCNESPGSIGVYSEKAQESSGLVNVGIQRFHKAGIYFSGFGCQHFAIEHSGGGPGGQAIGEDDVCGIHLESVISANALSRITTFGNPSISCYGTAIKLSSSSQCVLRDIHTESAYNSIQLTGGSIARIYTHTPGPGIIRGLVVSSDSTMYAIDGGTSLVDEASGKKYSSFLQGQNLIGNEVHRFLGRSAQGGDVAYFENNGQNVRVNRLGRIEVDAGNRKYPNVLIFGAGPNFEGTQGGWIGVNSQGSVVYPNWIQTSDKLACSASASTNKLTLTGWPTSGHSRSDYIGEHWTWTLADGEILYSVGTDGAGTGLAGGLSYGQAYYVVSADAAAKTFSLSLTAGGAAVDITSDAASMYVTHCPYAGFYRMGAQYFEFRSGNAANASGTDPGEMVLQARSDFGVHASRLFFFAGGEQRIGNPFGTNRARLSHGQSGQSELRIERSVDSEANWSEGWVFHLADGHLIIPGGMFPSGQRSAGDYAGAGSPEGVLAAFKGSTYRDITNGDFYVRLTGSGFIATGWVNVSAAAALWEKLDANTIQTIYRPKLTHSSYDASRPVVLNGSKEMDTDTALDAAWIADGSVTNAEFQYLGGVTSDVQAQLNALDARLDTLEAGAFVTKAQHNAHDHLYTGDGSGTVSDHTSTANPTL